MANSEGPILKIRTCVPALVIAMDTGQAGAKVQAAPNACRRMNG
ncbi:hypothetical protein [uncultured Mucilaginibacter sp.]|nr:hypothetical protein [uncultured Mucilaginibacter sp.]